MEVSLLYTCPLLCYRIAIGVGAGVGAGVVGVGAVVAAPFVLGAMGFTSAGIAAGSWAAGKCH